jgi:predicted nucleic acid-binding protein
LPILDASSAIHASDSYPETQFPPLWNWIENQITAGTLCTSVVAMGEIADKAPDCAAWLADRDIQQFDVDTDIANEAVRIKTFLGIEGDNYHPKGVGENDLLIIATARIQETELISDEAVQTNLPDIMPKFKIPAVCDLPEVQVTCRSFLSHIKASNQVFG